MFRLLAGLPLFLALFLPFVFQARKKWLGDENTQRRRLAGKQVRQRLREARRLQRAGEDRAFYTELARALRAYLAGKLNMPPADLDREMVRSRVGAATGDDALGSDVVALLDECEMAVYAPSTTAGKEELLHQTEALIGRLEKSLGKS